MTHLSVAQLEEYRFPKAGVGGSSPSGEAKLKFKYTKRTSETRIVVDEIISNWVSDTVLGCFNVVQIDAIRDDETVGYVELIQTVHGHWETHIFVDEEERGKGLGVALFAKAFNYCLRRNQSVMSSTYTSDDANRLWLSKRLNQRYVIGVTPSVAAVTPNRWVNFVEGKEDEVEPAKRSTSQFKLFGRR